MVRLPSLLGLALMTSCGLINPDVTNFALKFPEADFTVDTSNWVQGSGTVPQVSCSIDSCSAEQSQICGGNTNCSVDCDTSTNNCQAHIRQSLVQSINLAVQAPEYQTIKDQPAAKVTIDSIYFVVKPMMNTLNVATPPLQLFMAPVTVMDPSDPSAKLIGTVQPIEPTQTGITNLTFASGGKAAMEGFMDDFHTPFNVIVTGQADVHGGDPVPQGMMVGYMSADAHAGI